MASTGSKNDTARRPFWIHQIAEYILGLALISAGLQSLTPTVPVLAGGLVVVNAAIVTGPLAAWRTVSRPLHRWFDVAVMAVLVIAALLPFLDVDNSTRLLMGGVAAIMFVIWTTTNFDPPRPKRQPGQPVDRSEAIGRTAGRLVSQGRSYARKYKSE